MCIALSPHPLFSVREATKPQNKENCNPTALSFFKTVKKTGEEEPIGFCWPESTVSLSDLMNMGLVGGLVWVNAYSRKQCRSLFWRMRAALKKKALKISSGKQQFRFQYDPSSYALNFDDGCWKSGENANRLKHAKPQHHSDSDIKGGAAWVYVLWVISE